mmetsp:Transcript_3959/g.7639  ORF Transcript_3959/g.7639 Transcript_3959/m.7639 type:complete len:146 (-) Transcript_3959:792-1229(-)
MIFHNKILNKKKEVSPIRQFKWIDPEIVSRTRAHPARDHSHGQVGLSSISRSCMRASFCFPVRIVPVPSRQQGISIDMFVLCISECSDISVRSVLKGISARPTSMIIFPGCIMSSDFRIYEALRHCRRYKAAEMPVQHPSLTPLQ